jgi:4-hydroxy-tetrahydrodipicolinate reductase
MENETIEIKHKAQDRSIFALGALKGALWLSNKTSGFYSMSDIYSS